MRRRLSRRARRLLVLALCLAAVASAAGLALSLRGGGRAQASAAPAPGRPATASPAAPGSAQARADLGRMRATLNSGSVSAQAALLAPPLKFASGSGPVVPAGKTITILPGTLHASGNHGTVRARLSGGTAVTLGLYLTGGHWRLYGAEAGSAQTSAKVTGQPVMARLLADKTRINHVPTEDEIGTRTPVIFVHGIGGHGGDWGSMNPQTGEPDDPSSMLYTVNQVPGTYILTFSYEKDGANYKWVDNPASGPEFTRYVNRVARVSKAAHGPGQVIVVAFSMGGLVTRYAASNGAADSIAMVITIGTPNKGSFISDARNLVCDNPTILPSIAENIQPGLCTQWTAAGAMSVFNSKISQLPMLPTAIPIVHAIAGDQHLVWKVLNATVDAPIDGDGVVPLWSALAKRPGGTQDTFDRVTNPLVPANWSAMHLELQRNTSIMQLVTGYVSGWIREHPLPAASACPTSGDVPGAADCYAHPPATAQPAAAPALGGDAYWLADGGRWYVHDAGLRISRGPSGLTGTETWNAYGTIVTGTIHLAFTSQPDGSLLGTYTDNTVYTTTPGRDASMFQPDPAAPRQGEVIRLVPVAPMHAKSVYVSRPGPLYANTNWCQAGLPNGWKWCGA